MGTTQAELTGPDLAKGIAFADLPESKPVLGHAAGEAVVIVRRGDQVDAVAATCTHYGGPLAEGLVVGDTLRCPWHHACFELRTGAASAPALSPVACWQVERDGDRVRLIGKRDQPRPQPARGPASVLIVGAGAAGGACALALRERGYPGPITMVGAEGSGPVDRPNLSKDYLAGNAPEEWIPLRSDDDWRGLDIEIVASDAATALDAAHRRVTLSSGRTIDAEAIVIATGAEPIRLPIPGAALPHVHVLRSLADSRAIIERAATASRAVVIGASFIGLEVAASLRIRGLEVDVVAPEAIPLARIMGDAVGQAVRAVHEAHGTRFHLGVTPSAIDEHGVALSNGERLAADLVVMGVGVRPRIALAEAAGLAVDRGIAVDDQLRTSAPGIWACGDVAVYPDGRGDHVRIEHWVVAERQGQAVARGILGGTAPYRDVPFFWSAHHELTLNYVGHAERFDHVVVLGDLGARDAAVVYHAGSRIVAVTTIGRDHLALEVEAAMERGDDAALEALLR